jgi:predicted short-subunit dehydrogenase-like oxidoreductase (DUF2520 family)
MITRTRHRKGGSPSHPRSENLSVAIIGAGRLGTALAIALSRAGYSVGFISAKHTASARRAAKLSGAKALTASITQLRRLDSARLKNLTGASVLIIATPDDAIRSVAQELALLLASGPSRTRAKVALHTSGALSAEELSPLKTCGLSVGSIHPLVSISEPITGAEWLTHAYFSVEGDSRATKFARRIVQDLGSEAFSINSRTKALYHAAALMASPNLTALVDIALEMLGRCGLAPNRARKVLLPLIQSTIDNLATQTTSRALTGTFKRADVATVRRHLDAILSQQLFDALEAYVLLGRRSLKLANHPARRRKPIDQILANASKTARRS